MARESPIAHDLQPNQQLTHRHCYARVNLPDGRRPVCWCQQRSPATLHEFLAIVTHPKIYSPPTPLSAAIDQAEAWLESPSIMLLQEMAGYWMQFRNTIESGRIIGERIHDARIAALCQLHDVKELWTADRDFSHFPAIRVRNPLIK